MRGLIENLHKISTRLLLHQHGRNQELKIGNRDTGSEIQHRLAERKSKVLLVRSVLEFCSDRVRHFSRNHVYCGREGLSGAKTTGHEIDRLWKKVRKAAEPARPHLLQNQ